MGFVFIFWSQKIGVAGFVGGEDFLTVGPERNYGARLWHGREKEAEEAATPAGSQWRQKPSRLTRPSLSRISLGDIKHPCVKTKAHPDYRIIVVRDLASFALDYDTHRPQPVPILCHI